MEEAPVKEYHTQPPDKIYYGRGHTQNTWYENYEALTKANTKGWDFLNKPELLLQMEPSIWASFYAMFSGLYTGRKFSNFDSSKPVFYLKCRGIINGSDRADLIAVYAEKFEKCLV
jgi:predicted chitinase